ncbi:hypothetical protein BO71DRAFT_115890 [Aspergillus ellipticus CBS 707.79]|uniref:Uncharacterized protein n=1 Tax=Aspergillus ellipticus CBS 707.79 TaxID=1448320 RepID=A0A319E1V5_9EURO|nr:hypothetical protein BO71DRAFT_115890 [Aspergillus ellipticus CBS 707.79]
MYRPRYVGQPPFIRVAFCEFQGRIPCYLLRYRLSMHFVPSRIRGIRISSSPLILRDSYQLRTYKNALYALDGDTVAAGGFFACCLFMRSRQLLVRLTMTAQPFYICHARPWKDRLYFAVV